ncbi:hypothetical protein [Streptomyces sp. NPDC047315]|uniref:hypothetical protein n=1 Tax=Streptomyces sp. NPDC047315 TaxID=3155142 RepID=UPI0033FF3EB3
MGRFEDHGIGLKADFDVRVGPAHSTWKCQEFASQLRTNVEHIMGITFHVVNEGRDPTGGYRFWFANDDLSIQVIVDDPEEGWPLEKVPAYAIPISRSEDVGTWEIAEKLYNGLDALGTYLLIALESHGSPVASNFEIGDY